MPTDYAGCSVALLKASLILLMSPTCKEIGCSTTNALAPHTVWALVAETEAYLWEENKNIEFLLFWSFTKVKAANNSRHTSTASDTVLPL